MEKIVASDKNNRNGKKKDGDEHKNNPERPSKRVKYTDHDQINEKHYINLLSHPRKSFNNLVNYGDLEPSLLDGDCCSLDVKASLPQQKYELNEKTRQKKLKVNQKNITMKQHNRKQKQKDDAVHGIEPKKKHGKKKAWKNKEKVVKVKRSDVPCKFFLEGRCTMGTDCTFSHATQPLPKKQLCKFYVFGFCTKIDCLYMHEEFPCKYFHTGAKCYSNQNCRFSHAPLTEETNEILMKYLESTKDQNKENEANSKDASHHKQQLTFNTSPCHVKEAEETIQISQVQQHPEGSDRHNSPQDSPTPSAPDTKPNFYVDILQSTVKNPSLMSMTPRNQAPIKPNFPISPIITIPGVCSYGKDSNQVEEENNADIHQRNMVKDREKANTLNNSTDIFVKECTAVQSAPISTKTEEQANGRNSEKINEAVFQMDEEIVESTNSANVVNSALEFRETNKQEIAIMTTPLIPTQFPREVYLRIQQQKIVENGTDIFKDPGSQRRGEYKKRSSNKYTTERKPLSAFCKDQQAQLPNTSQQHGASSNLSKTTIDIAKMLTEIRQQAMQKSSSNESNTITTHQEYFWKNFLAGASATIKDPCPNASIEHQLWNKSEWDLCSRSNTPSIGSVFSLLLPKRHQINPTFGNKNSHLSSINYPSDVAAVGVSPKPLSFPPSLKDDNSDVIDQNSWTTDETKALVDSTTIPYKVCFITASQPNYSSSVLPNHSNSKLLNDPRLQKYFKQQHLTDDAKNVIPTQNLKCHFERQTKANAGNDVQESHISLAEFWNWLKMS